MSNPGIDYGMNSYTFYWSPEGRPLATYAAKTEKQARAQFKREFRKSYARYMGEVYVIPYTGMTKAQAEQSRKDNP